MDDVTFVEGRHEKSSTNSRTEKLQFTLNIGVHQHLYGDVGIRARVRHCFPHFPSLVGDFWCEQWFDREPN